MISDRQIEAAIVNLANVEGVSFDPRFLVEDVCGVATAFPESEDFESAIAATARMLGLIVNDKVDVGQLRDDYAGWSCCHYQPRATRGARATMRIMFSRVDGTVRVRGFGDRRLPADFYHRMAELGRVGLGKHAKNSEGGASQP